MTRLILFWGTVALAALVVVVFAVGNGTTDELITALAALGYAVTGRLVIARRPDNAVGWILATIAVVLATGALTDGYLEGAEASDAAVQLVGWLNQLVWLVWLFALVGIALPLVFPDGRLPTRRWRWIAWIAAAGVVLGTLGVGFAPGPMDSEPGVENPFGIAAAETLLAVADGVSTLLLTVGVIGAGAGLIVRLRRSRGVERQQLKWFAYVAGIIVASIVVGTSTQFGGDAGWVDVVAPLAGLVLLAMVGFGIPLATGFAMLRHRLYDIDVVIKRTLVYGALTATLAAAYLASVLVLQVLLSPSSDLAIAGSTLAVAALFRPLRARIQGLVDRRFYRRSYDAARTVERFGAQLRDEVSLDALSDELRAVVADTMQPAHVSVWLRP